MLRIEHLVKKFDEDFVVLDDIDLSVNKGEVVVILGPSGCGKSTLLRCINGLEDIQDGRVLLEGEEINPGGKGAEKSRVKIGMVFQSYDLFPHMSILDNVILAPMKVQKRNKEDVVKEAREMLERVGLASREESYPRQLSGGQKQRVAIARALVLDPEILLCDEATSALDPEITKGILALLQKINKEMGITIVVVTHQMEVVKQICQRVAFLSQGKVLAVGRPEKLFVWPQEREIRDFLREESDKLPETGVNLKLFFYGEGNQRPIVTQMSQELHTDFNICWAKLEDFREDVYGSLVLNMKQEDLERACAFLDSKDVTWEVIE